MSENIVLDNGGTNQVTFRQTKVTKNFTKKLIIITPSTGTGNSAPPKASKIIDLKRVEIRFTIEGFFDKADRIKIEKIFLSSKVFEMVWDLTGGGSADKYQVDMEKLEYTENPEDIEISGIDDIEPPEWSCIFTCVQGVNI